MSSFNLQAGQIRGALLAAGLPAHQATAIANILGNSAQTLRHTGEVVYDRTPANLRQVSPDDRKHSLQGLDFRPGDPDFRPPRVLGSEQQSRPQQESTVLEPLAPQQTTGAFRLNGGAFTEVSGTGDSAKINLRVQGAGGGALFADPQSNTLVSKAVRAETNGDGYIQFYVEDNGDSAVWKLVFDSNTFQPRWVVTDVQYIPGTGLVITKQLLSAWFVGQPQNDVIPTCSQTVVTGISLGGDGLGVGTGTVEGFCGGGGGGDGGGGGGYTIPTTDCEDL